MWKKFKRVLVGPELPVEPMLLTVPTQGRFGAAKLTAWWHPRSLTVELAGVPVLTVFDEGLPRHLATSYPPPRLLLSAPRKLSLTVGGQPAPIVSGKRGMRRSTFSCTAVVGANSYRFTPTGKKRSELRRDGEVVGELAASKAYHTPESMSWASTATAQDVAVGVLLGTAVGVGARGFIRNLIDELAEFAP